MALSITPRLILAAAQRRGWQTTVLDEATALFQITLPDGRTYYIRNIMSHYGPGVNNLITQRKDIFYKLADKLGAQMPQTEVVTSLAQAEAFLDRYKKIVVKPADQSHGDGITVNITAKPQLKTALAHATKLSAVVLVQEQITGDDYRLLFIGGKLAAAAIREPASIIGDGQHTLAELMTTENYNTLRGEGYDKTMTNIDVEAANTYLGDDLHTVPAAGQRIQVVGTANIGKGGVAIDVTDAVDPKLAAAAQKIVDHFRLGLAGVDYLVTPEGQAYLIEVNTVPSLGLHEYPALGQARHTPDIFLDWLTNN